MGIKKGEEPSQRGCECQKKQDRPVICGPEQDPFFHLAIASSTVKSVGEYLAFTGKTARRIGCPIPRELPDGSSCGFPRTGRVLTNITRKRMGNDFACPFYQRHVLGQLIGPQVQCCSGGFSFVNLG
jgi:hypothetical protein